MSNATNGSLIVLVLLGEIVHAAYAILLMVSAQGLGRFHKFILTKQWSWWKTSRFPA